jgi:phosphate transport system permease protein
MLVVVLVLTLIFMVCSRGISTFAKDGIPLGSFFAGTTWNPHQNGADGVPLVGALPMIVGSFSVTLLSCLLALPFALGASIFVVEVAPGFGSRVFRPLTEVLVGIPSVVFGLVGLGVVVPWMRGLVGGTGYGILSASIVLAVMILPDGHVALDGRARRGAQLVPRRLVRPGLHALADRRGRRAAVCAARHHDLRSSWA